MPHTFTCTGCFTQECDTYEELKRVEAAHVKWHADHPGQDPPERH